MLEHLWNNDIKDECKAYIGIWDILKQQKNKQQKRENQPLT